jgi:hypothetical protein
MRLTELEPELLKVVDARSWTTEGVTLATADGVSFLCPACFRTNGGPVGTHHVICWRPRVPPAQSPGPGRWEFRGASLDELSLVAGSSSVQLTSGCRAHFLVQSGRIVFC